MKINRIYTSHVAKATLWLTGVALFALAVSLPANAQEASPANAQDANKDAPMTRQQADAILNELRQIRHLLENQAHAATPSPPPPVKGNLKIDGGYSLGSKDAPFTMVEFTDYQCPFCLQFETATFGEIRRKYVDTGKLRFISLNMPLNIHPTPLKQPKRCSAPAIKVSSGRCATLSFATPGSSRRQTY